MTNILQRRTKNTEEEKHSDTQRKPGEDRAGTGVLLPQAQECPEHSKLKESRKDSPSEPLEGARNCGNVDFGLWSPE